MFCPKCGSQHPDDASFCSKCGNAIAVPAEAGGAQEAAAPAPLADIVCTKCGTLNNHANINCTSCGSLLGGQQFAAAVADASRVAGKAVGTAKAFVVSEQVRTNPWAGALLGAVLALLVGTLVMAGFRSVGTKAMMDAAFSSVAGQAGGSEVAIIRGIAESTAEKVMPKSTHMLLIAQGATYEMNGSVGAGEFSVGLNASGRGALSLMTIIPALALLLGGYAALRYSQAKNLLDAAWRGALVAGPYAVLAALIALFMKSSVSTSMNLPSIPFLGSMEGAISASSSVGLFSSVFTSLAMGAIFGAVGGVVAARGKGALQDVRSLVGQIEIPFRPQLRAAMRAMTGLLVVAGLLAVALLIWGMNAMPENEVVKPGMLFGAWLGILPSLLASVAVFVHGAPYTVVSAVTGSEGIGGQVGLIGAAKAFYGLPLLLGLLPLALIAYVSLEMLRTSGVTDRRAAIIEGAKVAVPYSAIIMLLAYATVYRFDASVSLAGAEGYSATLYAGYGVFAATFAAMLVSLAGGALGGWMHSRSLAVPAAAVAVPVAAPAPAPQAAPVVPAPVPASQAVPVAPATTSAPQAAPSAAAVFCTQCGSPNPADSRFCDSCGASLSDDVPSN